MDSLLHNVRERTAQQGNPACHTDQDAATKLPGRFPNLGLDPTSPFALYTAAALAIPAIVPYTLTAMVPTNDKLHAKAADSNSMSDAETKRLLWKWQRMNYNRSIFVGTGAVLGAVAMVMS